MIPKVSRLKKKPLDIPHKRRFHVSLHFPFGGVAHLVERDIRIVEVVSSSLIVSTISANPRRILFHEELGGDFSHTPPARPPPKKKKKEEKKNSTCNPFFLR